MPTRQLAGWGVRRSRQADNGGNPADQRPAEVPALIAGAAKEGRAAGERHGVFQVHGPLQTVYVRLFASVSAPGTAGRLSSGATCYRLSVFPPLDDEAFAKIWRMTYEKLLAVQLCLFATERRGAIYLCLGPRGNAIRTGAGPRPGPDGG